MGCALSFLSWWWFVQLTESLGGGRLNTVNGYDPIMGYLELGMADDALSELEAMSAVKKKTERYGELLLATQMMLKQWTVAAETAQRLCVMNSTETCYFIHAAFCLHEIGDTEGAMKRLMSGPRALMKDALYHYNLACYQAVLGQKEVAGDSLKRAIELDAKLRAVALKDDDLEGVEFE